MCCVLWGIWFGYEVEVLAGVEVWGRVGIKVPPSR